jgi:16S rRNA (cytosine1402-N4)-methyltransferase
MVHKPVMVAEVVHYLLHERSRLVFDGTLGGGSHSRAILEENARVSIVGVDTDADALRLAGENLDPYGERVRLERASYAEAPRIASETGKFDGALLDLGVSSFQLDEGNRGFSYLKDGPLDMRMSQTGETAAQLIERTGERELGAMLKRFGEVTGASRIARSVKRASASGAMGSTGDLARAVRSALGGRPAPDVLSRVFQAIRIAVNGELENIRSFLGSILGCVNPEARLVFLSYHSLEDRTIKEFFRRESADCICPPGIPVCACGHLASLEVLTRRAVKPSDAEVASNPRARSARLRAARVFAQS